MSTLVRALALALAMTSSLPTAMARALWIPEEFDPTEPHNTLRTRDETVCGGDANLDPCGGDFPSTFCCPASTECLMLNTTASTIAAICCPTGMDCTQINTVECDESLQDPVDFPDSQLHSDPPRKLDSCGEKCCPMGYACEDDRCVARAENNPASTASPTKPISEPAENRDQATSDKADSDSDSKFNGSSFAAGFVPGLVIGAIIAACLVFLCIRKRKDKANRRMDEKRNASSDTLTDLSSCRANTHGRSISEPTADPSAAYRSEFLRSTSSRRNDAPTHSNYKSSYTVDARDPATPPTGPPYIRPLFSSRSAFANEPPAPTSLTPPSPAHLKRGTFTFTISPIRALRKQQSTHSLRRQVAAAAAGIRSHRASPRQSHPHHPEDRPRSASTETINIAMDPDPPQQSAVPGAGTTSNSQNRTAARYRSNSDSTLDTKSSLASKSSFDFDPPFGPGPLHLHVAPDTPTRAPITRNPPESHNTSYPTNNNANPSNRPTNPSATPAPPPVLGSPYTPSRYNYDDGYGYPGGGVGGDRSNGGGGAVGNSDKGRHLLGVGPGQDREGDRARRVTTFSEMMERAGVGRVGGM